MDSLQKIAKSPIAVVCHDAGAANLIVHWLKDYEGIIFPCIEGPAKKIWKLHFPEIEILRIKDVINNLNTLLTGTGNSDFEHNARVMAQNKCLISISVIDHWTSYRERFTFKNKTVLPDLILVSDRFAKKLSQSTFPLVKVVQLDNLYLINEVKLVFERRKRSVTSPPIRILVVMENFKINSHNKQSLGFTSLEYLISNIHKINTSKNLTIRIRPHPSEQYNKYDEFIQRNILFEVSKSQDLYKDLAWADLVAGMQSFAMVVALHSKIPTISILPPNTIECILPYDNILKLKDF